MPRGRRRLQGTQGPDNSRARSTRSQSRRRTSTASGDSSRPLRRSSRLSNQANTTGVPAATLSNFIEITGTSQTTVDTNLQDPEPYYGQSSTDLARFPFPNNSTVAESDFHRRESSIYQPVEATSSSNSSASTMYVMNLRTQPPPTARIGHPIYPACSVQVRLRYGYVDPYEDVGRLVAVATLYAATRRGPLAAIGPDMISGRLVDSIHSVSENEEDTDDQVVGLASFPGVTIQQAGNYQIRVTLVRIPNSGEQAVNLQAVDSNIIAVS
ncbi:MAG: hypothetical protein M1822_001767 [Bathelium mastoideum]|nr:MAG: hypothetical protein M1822_001767 [Bathelium mastoideum]